MKKISIHLILMIICSVLVFPGTITVSIPNASTVWFTGQTGTISWTPGNCTNTDYKINIFKNAIDQANFVLQLTVSGANSKNWTIPTDLEEGNYILRVKNDGNECIGDSQVFKIIKKKVVVNPGQFKGIITIIQPDKSSYWRQTTSKVIVWKNALTKYHTIKIDLYRYPQNKYMYTIATILGLKVKPVTGTRSMETDTSSFTWNIPEGTFSHPGTYRIKISRVDGTASGESEVFHIKSHVVEALTGNL